MRFCLCTILFSLVLLLWVGSAGCVKEYSFEGRDSNIISDTIVTPLPNGDTTFRVASCNKCDETIKDNEWSLTINGSTLCGIIDTAIVSQDRDALTFFGPSHCSVDFGLIISVWLQPQALDQDWKHLQAGYASFYYYDNVGGGYMLQSRRDIPIALTIINYNHSTRAAEGIFSGATYTDDGEQVMVQSGKWKTWLK